MDKELGAAVQKIVERFSGDNTVFSYHDPTKKVYVLVVSGDRAVQYESLIKAAEAFATSETTRQAQAIAQSLRVSEAGVKKMAADAQAGAKS